MKKNIILYTLIALLTFSISSCKKDPEPGGTAMQAVAGEWWVQVRDVDGNFIDGIGDDYYHFSTYNTASNSSTQMWIDDLETFWLMKGKVNVNLADMTFSGDKIENVSPDYVGSGEGFTITEGKIYPKVTKGQVSKAVTDSIRFIVTFSDDSPSYGNEYVLSGYRRTKYSEDDHF